MRRVCCGKSGGRERWKTAGVIGARDGRGPAQSFGCADGEQCSHPWPAWEIELKKLVKDLPNPCVEEGKRQIRSLAQATMVSLTGWGRWGGGKEIQWGREKSRLVFWTSEVI